ncbi:MAG: AraC family transcriptional regulator [Spirochaetales bacterium]|nr:AraC family transcriptional regulator [Spirochaetales bacterium]
MQEEKRYDNLGSQYLRKEYISRVNRVIDYIDEHLCEQLTLEVLAGVANFSRFHFHRIFSSIIGESLSSYIQRLRVQKAAGFLICETERPVTDIALDCGFSGSAPFSRSFRTAYGMSPSEWRKGGWRERSKNSKKESKTDQQGSKGREASSITTSYIGNNNQQWRIKMKGKNGIDFSVDVKEVPEMNVAYVRHIGPYAGDSKLFEGLFGKLMKWAGPRNLINFPKTKMLTIYHDSPEITEEEKLRISVCLVVPEGTETGGDIGSMKIPGGKFAIGHFEIDQDQYGAAWNSLYGIWLPESGYQAADGPCYELYLNEPKEHPEGKHLVDIYTSVKPL